MRMITNNGPGQIIWLGKSNLRVVDPMCEGHFVSLAIENDANNQGQLDDYFHFLGQDPQ